MVKIYQIRVGEECIEDYVEYYRNDTHIYLISIETDGLNCRWVRIKKTDRNKKFIDDWENYCNAYRDYNNEWREVNDD
tara:strand:- start:210 stop:443 length:234 start_codon:yes stop_codon:yes gene_type:complete